MLTREEWLRRRKKAIIDSGYLFVLNKARVFEDPGIEERLDLSPEESAWLVISFGKEVYEMNLREEKFPIDEIYG